MKLLEKAAESEGLQGDTGCDEFADMVTVGHDANVSRVLMQRNGGWRLTWNMSHCWKMTRKAIGSRQVFKVKDHSDGQVERY